MSILKDVLKNQDSTLSEKLEIFALDALIDYTNKVESIKGADGRNGVDGIDGKDGADGKDGRDGVDGKDGKDGRDGVDGKDGVVKTIIKEIPVELTSQDYSTIARNLEDLPPTDKLDPELALKNFGDAVKKYQPSQSVIFSGGGGSGGGASTFTSLTDTPSTYTGSEQRFVKVNAAGTALEFVAGSGAAVAWGDITGTLSSQTDLQTALTTLQTNIDAYKTAQVYTVTNGATDRAFNADSVTINELADVLATLIADLKSSGIIV